MQPISSSFGVQSSLGFPIGTVFQSSSESGASAPATSSSTEDPSSSGSKPAPPSSLQSLLVPGLAIFAIFYFILIRPEKKKQASRKSMLNSIKKGTKVMTTSGLYGSVAMIKDDVITLQVADGVRLRFNRAAIQDVIDPQESAIQAEKSNSEKQEAVKESHS